MHMLLFFKYLVHSYQSYIFCLKIKLLDHFNDLTLKVTEVKTLP